MDALVHPKERLYFWVSLIVSVQLYVLLIVSIIGVFYIAVGMAIGLVVHGVLIGHLKGNAVRVTEHQFPEIHRLASELAREMDVNPVPAIYVQQAGGVLNAFATKFLGRTFVVVNSDMVEVGYDRGEAALAFVVAHELAHIKRRHLTWRWVLYPAMMVPFLGSAYSRACEYTCDRFGAHFRPSGALPGLLVLAAGKKLYTRMGGADFSRQADTERGFWVAFAEILATHPNLTKRVRAVAGREPDRVAEPARLAAFAPDSINPARM